MSNIIRDKKIVKIDLIKNERLKLPRVLNSTIEYFGMQMCTIEGAIIERSKISCVITSTIGRQVLVGPETLICASHLKSVKLRQHHAVVNSTFRRVLFYNCLFEGGTYKYGQFEDCVFINTYFSGCSFDDSIFRGCSFSGCVYYKCAFKDKNGTQFLECNLMPSNPLGQFFQEHNKWPDYAAMITKTNFIVCCTGDLVFTKCPGAANLIKTDVLPHNSLVPEPMWYPTEVRNRYPTAASTSMTAQPDGTKLVPVNEMTGLPRRSSIPPLRTLAQTFSNRQPVVPVKHRRCAYIFATAGVR